MGTKIKKGGSLPPFFKPNVSARNGRYVGVPCHRSEVKAQGLSLNIFRFRNPTG